MSSAETGRYLSGWAQLVFCFAVQWRGGLFFDVTFSITQCARVFRIKRGNRDVPLPVAFWT